MAARKQSIMLVAGEPSGDLLGARLMPALRRASPQDLDFIGVGGSAMAAEGLQSILPMSDLSVMGLTEVVPRIPRLLAHIRRTAAFARRERPAVIVTIDAPGFNFRLAKRLRGGGLPIVHYVAPTVWAWRPGRAKAIAPLFEHLLALLPFEPPYFEAVGLDCTFVGHPAVEQRLEDGGGAAFRARHGIAAEAPLLAVLPGSRHSETSRLLGPFGAAVRTIANQVPDLRIVVPTLAHVADEVSSAARGWPGRPIVSLDEAEKLSAFQASNAALAASGTVSLELALAGVPMLVAYRVGALTTFIARRLVRTEHVNLVNLILGRRVIPEILHRECTAQRLAAETLRLLKDDRAGAEQMAASRDAMAALGAGGESPSDRAARAVLDVMARHASS